jgi:hypothetical protein
MTLTVVQMFTAKCAAKNRHETQKCQTWVQRANFKLEYFLAWEKNFLQLLYDLPSNRSLYIKQVEWPMKLMGRKKYLCRSIPEKVTPY